MKVNGYFRNCMVVAVIISFCSCTTIIPRTIIRDRFDYTAVLSDSWKEQMLSNIVRLRYGDAPVFLDVASVISSYELSGGASLNGSLKIVPDDEIGGNAGIEGYYANRPTITYIPLSGEKLAKNLIFPIPVLPILSLIQSGYQADVVFRAFIQSINGLENRYAGRRPADAEFYGLIKKLRHIQDAGAIGLRYGKVNEAEILMIVFRDKNDPEIEAEITEVKKMLGLDLQSGEFRVTYGTFQTSDKEITILSRSMLQILNEFAYNIEISTQELSENRVILGYKDEVVDGVTIPPLIKIRCSPQRPDDAFVAVPYQKQWFWIDNKDLFSKQLFSFLMFCFALEETNLKENTPIMTVPVR
jgi:hypothetical protein